MALDICASALQLLADFRPGVVPNLDDKHSICEEKTLVPQHFNNLKLSTEIFV